MALSTAIYTILHNNATIAAVFADRIYPGVVPFGASLPCIVYEIGDIQPNPTQDDDYVWDLVNVTVTAISTQYALSETYASQIRTCLNRYSGTLDGELIDTIIFDGMQPGYDPDFSIGCQPDGAGCIYKDCKLHTHTDMKVRVLKNIEIEGRVYIPSPEILEVWPSVARKGIISGQLEDIEGNFLAAWNARKAYKAKVEKRNLKEDK